MAQSASTDDDFVQIFYKPGEPLLHWHESRANFRAAGHPDPSALDDMLRQTQHLPEKDRLDCLINAVHSEHALDGNDWDSMLLHAISHHRPQNVAYLLRHGADPNGMELELMEGYSLRFRRVVHGRISSWDDASWIMPSQVGNAASQVMPLSTEDLHKRSSSIAKFWCDFDAPPLEAAPNGSLLHSLVMAARQTEIEIFDMLVDAGADASSWMGDMPELPSDCTASSLAVLTPLHAAVDAGDTTMLSAVLQRNLNPNCRALIVGSQALTPSQYAIFQGMTEMYKLLASHPLTDTSLTTPVLAVHVLHFAVAQLRRDLIEAIDLPFSAAPATALGHTLLHVACLPLNEEHVQLLAPRVWESTHDVRTFDPWWTFNPWWLPIQSNGYNTEPRAYHAIRDVVPSNLRPRIDGPGDPNFNPAESDFIQVLPLEQRRKISARHPEANIPLPKSDPREYHVAQTQIAKSIIAALGEAALATTDIYGNTPLHYLAGARIVNDELITWLRRSHYPLGDETWTKQKNRWGWTPADLWLDNVITIEPRLEDVPGLRFVFSNRSRMVT